MVESTSAAVLPFGKQALPFERRRCPRLTGPEIRARGRGRRVEILDMSQRGMAIRTSHPFSVGGSYLFELLGKGRSLVVEGRVCWSERTLPTQEPARVEPRPYFRSGVEFVGIQSRGSDPVPDSPNRMAVPAAHSSVDAEELTADRIARLGRSQSPDDSAELLLELLTADFEHLVLFRLQANEVRAWMGRGPTLVPDRLLRLRLRTDEVSVFQHLQEGGSFYYGTLPAVFGHLQLLRCWQGKSRRECALFPIRLNNRLVAVLYADAGDRPLEPAHLRTLQAASDLFTQSLIDQILKRKAQRAPGSG